MYLTQREKLEDLEQFKQAAEAVTERAKRDPEYRRYFLRAIGLGDSPEEPDAKPENPKRAVKSSQKAPAKKKSTRSTSSK